MSTHYAEEARTSADATKPADTLGRGAAITDLMMVHHGFLTDTELLDCRPLTEPLLPPLHNGQSADVGAGADAGQQATHHVYFPAKFQPLSAALGGSELGRYMYQHQTFSPDDGTTCSACHTGLLVNKVVLPVGLMVKGGQRLDFESYSAVFFRFKPVASDGTLGIATVRLPKNLTVDLKKTVYAAKPGGGEFDYKDDTVPVPTGLKTSWASALCCNVFAVPRGLPSGQAPEYLAPQLPRLRSTRSPLLNEHDDQGQRPSTGAHTSFKTNIPSHQINQRDELNFLYEAGKEYLVELRLSCTVQAESCTQPTALHGLMFEASTLVEAVYLDTRGYL